MIKKLCLGSIAFISLYHISPSQQKKDVQGFFNGFTNSFSAMHMVLLSLYDYQVELSKYPYNTEEYHNQRSIIHQRVADRILQLSIKNKGVYLKAGQYIGNLERVMPREFTQTLKVLQDQGPQTTFENIRIVIEDELNKKLEDVFEQFEPHAIAAASLAQVHRAKLKNGDDVAVKVQFPWLRVQYRYDLMIIHNIARLCDIVLSFNSYQDMNFSELFATFRNALEKELDFNLEATNGRLTRQQFNKNYQIYIPEYHLCTKRLLVMEFIEGVKITDINKLENPKECARILIEMFGQMIFRFGHVHCDAHPGNILIRKHVCLNIFRMGESNWYYWIMVSIQTQMKNNYSILECCGSILLNLTIMKLKNMQLNWVSRKNMLNFYLQSSFIGLFNLKRSQEKLFQWKKESIQDQRIWLLQKMLVLYQDQCLQRQCLQLEQLIQQEYIMLYQEVQQEKDC